MIESTRVIYKGDIMAAFFYGGIGFLMFVIAALLQYFNISPGFLYLSYGLLVFSVYCIGKGIIMNYIYRKRYLFYKNVSIMKENHRSEEILYTESRILRKNQGRRLHVYVMILGSVIAFCGIFSMERGLIMGTSIPIVLLSGIEFSVGLLTEFRLQEYLRILKKQSDDPAI
jgi:hypothetical protein